ncbi:TetR/AcrR family transcriptional regulator, partial [Acinetobacter baumannii]|nr:TetR/AcrR family transcriptional regulator [Acinetobacter baumannii]
MQLKKKDILMMIQKTALEMFYNQGYMKTKMSDIAKEMEMSVGNIYTYFKNKEELFYNVVPEETITYFEEVILIIISTYNDVLSNQKSSAEFASLIEKPLQLIVGNYREVVIMLDQNEGTIYE